jgi:RNA polymerase sigma factor (sigma-70 family)
LDINDKIAENTGLIYKQLTSFNLLHDQDAESFAYEALYRAIQTFDESAGVAFSTYAVCVINNALRKHLRTLNRKRQLSVISYYEQANPEMENSGYLLDMLKQADDVEAVLVSTEACSAIRSAFIEEYEKLSPTYRKIVDALYLSDGKVRQNEIAKAVGVSQPTVSKAISQFRHKVKLRLEEQE